uniref:exosortase-associated EpsI family protein n=1 Tax=Salmonella sp. SAL04284 TaxID=3159862 RepID=UPI00397C0DBC
ARSHAEKEQVHAPLASFPLAIGGWMGRDVQISADVLNVLGPGEFLSRIYQSPTEPYIDFFLAYFPNQKSGDSIHSPKN